MASYDEMSIPQLETEISRIEDVVAVNRKEQRVAHDVMERKIKLIPITPTANDQVIMSPSIRSILQTRIPAALWEQIKGFLPEDK